MGLNVLPETLNIYPIFMLTTHLMPLTVGTCTDLKVQSGLFQSRNALYRGTFTPGAPF